MDDITFPDYAVELERCTQFLREFREYGEDDYKYKDFLQKIANREETLLKIELDDVQAHLQDDFVERITSGAHRYLQLWYTAVDRALPAATKDISDTDNVWDVLSAQRQNNHANARREEDAELEADADLPPALTRRFEILLVPSSDSTSKPLALRNVRAADIGRLVTIKAMVTRVSDVKPLVTVSTYTCDKCGVEVYQEILNRQYKPLDTCPSRQCTENRAVGRLHAQTRGSKFMKYQELRIQELPDQVPIGHIPRSMSIHCRGTLTRLCTPGDVVLLTGIFLPSQYQGFRALKAGLLADTYVEAQWITKTKQSYDEFKLTEDMAEEVKRVSEDPATFQRMAQSIAPEIYGHENVKKALLLQLVGGVTRTLPGDGMKIRGDINICLMGDPGVAKSQLLKYIASVSPRGVYTTGKGSSGVGLTAAVCRDPVTSEMSLEGGALVLADRGVCCIDEFDKMDEGDRTAIHEVMEQQSVSIAKAGITTTLNARAAVLAAANPLFGRYNPRRPLSENINLPNSLISRFDLIFLLLDKPNENLDRSLAKHVTFVHQNKKNPPLGFTPFTPAFMKEYISLCRHLEPHIPRDLTTYIVEQYVGMRQRSTADDKLGDQMVMTARQLLSILRLSQALARIRFLKEVTRQEVQEAIELTDSSKASLIEDEESQGGYNKDVTSRIYDIIREYASKKNWTAEYSKVEAMVIRRGLSKDQFEACLRTYEKLGVFAINETRTEIMFIDAC